MALTKSDIDVHLEDGGGVVVMFSDAAVADDAGDPVIDVLIHGEGGEGDMELAVAQVAEGLGLHCETRSRSRPTVLLIAPSPPPMPSGER